MPKRYDNIIHKLFLRSKRITKVTLSSITIIGLIIYIKDLEEISGVDYAYVKDIEAEETTMVDIITTGHLSRDTPVTPYIRPPVSTDSEIGRAHV